MVDWFMRLLIERETRAFLPVEDGLAGDGEGDGVDADADADDAIAWSVMRFTIVLAVVEKCGERCLAVTRPLLYFVRADSESVGRTTAVSMLDSLAFASASVGGMSVSIQTF